MENTLKNKALLVIIILFIVAAESCGQYCIRICKTEQKWHFFILGVIMYSFVCLGLYISYGYKTMGIINLLWSCLSIISIVLIGIVFFHDTVTVNDIIGILFIFLGFIFIFIKGH